MAWCGVLGPRSQAAAPAAARSRSLPPSAPRACQAGALWVWPRLGKCLPHAETAGRLCRGMSVSAEGAAPSPGPPASSQAGCPGLICEDPVLSEGPVLTPRCHCSLLQGVTTTHGRQEGRPGPSTCLCDVCPVVSPTRPGLGGRMLTPKGTGPGHPGCWASNVDRPWARPGASSQVLQVQARVGVGPARGAPGDQGAKLQASHRAGSPGPPARDSEGTKPWAVGQ